MSKRQAQMRGIVVAADSAEKAQELYRSVITGSKVQVLESADGEFQITTASDSNLTLLNPVDGEQMSVVFDGHLPDSMNAVASSSKKTVEATYMVCTAGCGNHIIADDETILQRCPACASDLPTLEDDNVKKQNNGENTQPGETIIAFASTIGIASEKYAAMVRGDAETHNYDCSGVVVASASEMNFDPYQAIAAAKLEDYEPQILQAIAGSAQEVEAHHYVCVSSSCGMHVLASDESPLFCPHCSSGLIDPQDSVATASDDEDDLDDDLDDEDDCEEDDCEEDDEDDYEEEEDDEDVLTLSVSSAQTSRKGGARKKQVAVGSAQGERKQVRKQVCVAASFVTYAADQLDTSKLEVAYAGTLKGEPTWIAFHDGIPFAKATASSSNQKDIFANAVFGKSFLAMASERGVANAMQEMGFTEIKPEIQVEQYVQQEIASQVAEKTDQIAQAASRDAAELSSRFLSAVATASQGINRGFFKGIKNPIISAIASTLEEVGIRNAEPLVAQAFARNSDAYHQSLIAKANELLQYDLEVQNQMAQAVAEFESNVETATASAVPVGRAVNVPDNARVHFDQREVATAASAQNDFQTRLAGLSFGNRR